MKITIEIHAPKPNSPDNGAAIALAVAKRLKEAGVNVSRVDYQAFNAVSSIQACHVFRADELSTRHQMAYELGPGHKCTVLLSGQQPGRNAA